MELEQFVEKDLGHASYLVMSEATGEALVFDPRRDIDVYLDAERRLGARIVAVIDSHQHNDYVSGILELAARTGATTYASALAQVRFAHEPLSDGDTLTFGELSVTVVHTPGHTPEHVSLLLAEKADGAAILLSGGALLVGDVARPDLLGGPKEKRAAARALCQTLQNKVLPLDDHVLVYPTHVAGSLCGGNIGSRFVTTIGYERKTNPLLAQVEARDVFVEECVRTDDLPAVPPYWSRLRLLNTDGALPASPPREPRAFSAREVAAAIEGGAVVLDVRAPEAFAGGHIPEALNAGLAGSFVTWAGTIVPPERDLVLVLDRDEDVRHVTRNLLRIGFAAPLGWLAGGMLSWRVEGREITFVEQITAIELARRRQEFAVLDVRQPAEWRSSRLEDAHWITGAQVAERLEEVPTGRVAVLCSSGYRSSAIASLLLHHGRPEVANVLGGMRAWKAAGLPTLGSLEPDA
ncbi:MAG TPA: MBL fold metallo-hydrolase [Actinomycetota bacterium]|nr:MBL fold metallo-hydrolase [Actinomycetota bacterium]